MPDPFLSVVIPVKNEQLNIGQMLRGLVPYLPEGSEIILIPATEDDQTWRAWKRGVSEAGLPQFIYHAAPSEPSVAAQLKLGFWKARGEAILVTMADMCDDPEIIPDMLEVLDYSQVYGDPCDMVCASRYMKGGRQIGAPRVKSWLSWLAGWSLHALGLPTHDPSNSYKLYRASKLKALELNNSLGFDINLEIMARALEAGWRITEVPTTWRGRQHGDSSFRFWAWLPFYALWWVRIAWRLLCAEGR